MSLPRKLGRYEVLSRLATGGMAEILLARVRGPAGFHRPVVLKRVLPHLAEDEAFRAMFLDEAGIVAGLRHANVVHVHELGEEDGELFLVLEYLAGESASGLMRGLAEAQRPLPLPLAAHVVAEACAGLHAAHELTDADGQSRHVVHRDVSPQNLFVTYDGEVKVLDFGVAKARARLSRTHTGQAKGKLGYMSPEQCRQEEVDRRTDVFALGVVLHELITGRRLFARDSEAAIVRAICDDPIEPPSTLRPDCPEALDRICMRALEKEPLDRYDSADAMRLDLVRAIRALAPDAVPRDDLAALMRDLFAPRITEKETLLHTARQEPTGPTTAVTLPTRLRWPWLLAAAAALVALGTVPFATSDPAPPAGVANGTAPSATRDVSSGTVPNETSVVVVEARPGAEVRVDGEPRGETPVRLRLPRGDEPVTLTLSREGYEPEERLVTPDVDEQRIVVEMSPVDAEPEPPRRTARPGQRRAAETPPPAMREFYLFD